MRGLLELECSPEAVSDLFVKREEEASPLEGGMLSLGIFGWYKPEKKVNRECLALGTPSES